MLPLGSKSPPVLRMSTHIHRFAFDPLPLGREVLTAGLQIGSRHPGSMVKAPRPSPTCKALSQKGGVRLCYL